MSQAKLLPKRKTPTTLQEIRQFQKEQFFPRESKKSIRDIDGDETIDGAISKWGANPSGVLLLMGPAGRGKSLRCYALFDIIPLVEKYRYICYEKEFELFQKCRQAISEGHDYYSVIKHKMSEHNLIMIDDLGSQKQKDFQRDLWYCLSEEIWSKEKPAVITTNLTQEDIRNTYDYDRIYSRLFAAENTIVDFSHLPDYRQYL